MTHDMRRDRKISHTMVQNTLKMMNLEYFTDIEMLVNDWNYPCTFDDLDNNVRSYINVAAGFKSWNQREQWLYEQFEIFITLMDKFYHQ